MNADEMAWCEKVRRSAKINARDGLEVCKLALADHPKSHGLNFLAGYLMVRLGQPAAAAAVLQQASRISPDHLPTWRELARAQFAVATTSEIEHETRDAWLSAAESLTQIITVQPLAALVLFERASALCQINDRAMRSMACVDALCAMSTNRLDDRTHRRAHAIATEIAHEHGTNCTELSRQLVDRVRGLSSIGPIAGARLAREAARVCNASYGMFDGVLFADGGEFDEAVMAIGTPLKTIGSKFNPFKLATNAKVPVSNPEGCLWCLASRQGSFPKSETFRA